jgi:hypothetical protein
MFDYDLRVHFCNCGKRLEIGNSDLNENSNVPDHVNPYGKKM